MLHHQVEWNKAGTVRRAGAAGASLTSRRLAMLTGSALTSAVAMVSAPQSVLAQCATTGGSVQCTGTFATSDSISNAATNMARVQSIQYPVTVTVTSGANIGGYGLSISPITPDGPLPGGPPVEGYSNVVAGGNITFTNNGTINQTLLPLLTATSGGTAALAIIGNGGDVTYTGAGSVSSTVANAIDISNTGSGNVNFGTAATPITPNYSGASGLNISTVFGNQNVFINNGNINVTGNTYSGTRGPCPTDFPDQRDRQHQRHHDRRKHHHHRGGGRHLH